MRELENTLNQNSIQSRPANRRNGPTKAWVSLGKAVRSILTSLSRIGHPHEKPTLPQHQTGGQSGGGGSLNLTEPHPEPLYLLLCIPHRKCGTRLEHLDVASVASDQLLFATIRDHYCEMRGRWKSFMSLKKPKAIRFVQVGVPSMAPMFLTDSGYAGSTCDYPTQNN